MENKAKDTVTGNTMAVGSSYFAEHISGSKTTSQKEIDHILGELQAHKEKWIKLEIAQRIRFLDEMQNGFLNIKQRWVKAELKGKNIAPQSIGEAEEWGILATVFRAVRKIKQSLLEIQQYGKPRIPGPIKSLPNGQIVAHVFPQTAMERLLFWGVSGEVWMQPGLTANDVMEMQANAYHNKNRKPKVALVLGAGNASMLPVIDLLHKLFVQLQVVVLKLNPVNEYMGPLICEALSALIDRGYLRVVYGGAEQGAYLCNHALVNELHLTGSDKTYEAVVFGAGEQGRQRKSERRPINTKPFTGELGNVSPVIIVPGPWKRQDLEEQAKYISTWLVANAGFACLTPRVIVQHKSWNCRNQLIEKIGQVLSDVPTRRAFYPGAMQRHAEFLAAHPESFQYGAKSDDHLPWTLIADVSPENSDDICFKQEAFCALFAETAIEAPTVDAFIDKAVEFANRTLWGTLSATLIVHPHSLKDPKIARAVDRAIANLQYGTVSINMLAYWSAYFMVTPWGAFPGHDIYDIQSGIGKTFNFLMLEDAQKSVVKAPFKRLEPTKVTSKRAFELCKKLAEFEAAPSWFKLPGLALAALRN